MIVLGGDITSLADDLTSAAWSRTQSTILRLCVTVTIRTRAPLLACRQIVTSTPVTSNASSSPSLPLKDSRGSSKETSHFISPLGQPSTPLSSNFFERLLIVWSKSSRILSKEPYNNWAIPSFCDSIASKVFP
ncbi:Uncharacterized protein HZ326_4860 [Fusarium oxysporum f. sp. albedinis]|nr:Uncharacterized protein HZ326_4860 [Fusarium oxysporum f. sp. albedinis]